MFSSPLTARERILLYGEPGVGKGEAVLSIARMLKATKSPGRVYVIDNDKSYLFAAELQSLGDYLIVEEVYDFPEYRDALNKFLKKITPNDFLVCDLMSESWSAVQTYYTDQIHGDEAAYFLEFRKRSAAGGNALDGWTDWQYINKLYFNFAKPFVYKSPCHIIACATADPVARPKAGSTVGDDKETISVFGSVGWKPDGQKRLKHQFNTTIFLFKDNRSIHRMTSVKDRGRSLIIGQEVHNFAIDYLKNVAQWKVTA